MAKRTTTRHEDGFAEGQARQAGVDSDHDRPGRFDDGQGRASGHERAHEGTFAEGQAAHAHHPEEALEGDFARGTRVGDDDEADDADEGRDRQ